MPMAPWPDLRPASFELVTADGVRLHGETYGPAPAPATVVLLHGYQLSQRLWARQVEALRTALPELRVLTYDHRGHGLSDRGPADRATLGQLARDLRLVLDTQTQGPVVLVGHSMGGMTIMSLAEQHPELLHERVAGVALLGTSSGGLAENTFGLPTVVARVAHVTVPRYNGWARRRVERGRPKPASPGTRWLLFGERPDPLDVRRTQDVLDATHPATSDDFYGTFALHDRTHALAALRDLPVVLVAGDRDRLTPLAHACTIADALPHARFVVLPGSGHMLQLERADKVGEALVELCVSSLRPAALRAG
jgi:pimeloyl-ACP methyl ester carboxylesterase